MANRLTVVVLIGLTFVIPPPAFADPPGRLAMYAMLATLPFMMLLTLLGGLYSTKFFSRETVGVSVTKVVCAFLMIGLSAASSWAAALTMIVFVAMALFRGFQLILQSKGTTKKAKSLLCGLLLIMTILFLGGAQFAFFFPVEDLRDDAILVSFVEYQIAYADIAKEKTGYRKFDRLADDDNAWKTIALGIGQRPDFLEINYSANGTDFQAFTISRSVPLWPYNLITCRPCFWADGSGKIRMQLVHSSGVRCSPDAPVIFQVTPELAKKSVHSATDNEQATSQAEFLKKLKMERERRLLWQLGIPIW